MMVRRMPRGDMAILSDGPPVNGHRPSADVLFHSVAQEFGLTSVGILMTGMGDDGAEGLGAIKAAGGMTVAQSEDTCVVSGMPRAAIVKGYANKIIPLDGLGAYLVNNYGVERSAIQLTTAAGICGVLDLLARGQLPQQGFIRQEDVSLEKFLAKLQVNSRVQAVILAYETGLVNPGKRETPTDC